MMIGDRRVGVIIPSSNTVVEHDFRQATEPNVTVHFARAHLSETTPAAEKEMLEEHVPQAASDLGSARVDLIAFACTSAAALLGAEGEAALVTQLSALADAPVVSTNEAVSFSLQTMSAGRVAVLTAYVDDLNQAISSTLGARGVDVVFIDGMGITDNFAIAEVTPDQLVEFAMDRLDPDTFDTLFVSCTNLRAMEAIDELEGRFGVPVVTSNSATIEAVETMLASL